MLIPIGRQGGTERPDIRQQKEYRHEQPLPGDQSGKTVRMSERSLRDAQRPDSSEDTPTAARRSSQQRDRWGR
jgi:hypothetical protein